MIGKLGVTVIDNATYLGELCNNPLNIMGSQFAWVGKVGMFTNSAGGYVVFGEKDNIPGWVRGGEGYFLFGAYGDDVVLTPSNTVAMARALVEFFEQKYGGESCNENEDSVAGHSPE